MSLPVYAVVGTCDLASLRVASLLRYRGARLVLVGPPGELLEVSARALGAHLAPISTSEPREVLGALEEGRQSFGSLDGVISAPGGELTASLALLDRGECHRWIAETVLSMHASLEAIQAVATGEAFPGIFLLPGAPRGPMGPHRAARMAILGALHEAAASQEPEGVRFNAVDPGLASAEPDRPIRASRRILRELASTVDWLLAPAQSWISGQVFGVDGRCSDSMRAS